ncbi:glycerate kinase type-2 family protein [Halobacterium yunchengense]|uniref:glycerate kinase type-2 family protein n=1 Tax=Halobacterium yunchengense TaxID=3108497 RepID=UPI00300A8636
MVDVAARDALADTPARETALSCVEAGVEAATPAEFVPDAVARDGDTLHVVDAAYDLASHDRVVAFGAGNAAAHVAAELAAVLGDRLDGGVVVTDDPVAVPGVEVLESDHPIPSARGVDATRRLLAAARDCGSETLALVVLTGGGSAVLPAPAGDLSLDDLRRVTDALLDSGAPIQAVNAVRKHCSAVKGGRLAAALAPATIATLAVSDVVGNDLSVVASGPTVPDETTYADALAVLGDYGLDAPGAVRDHLAAGARGDRPETPGADHPAFARAAAHVLADGHTALAAAVETARQRGYEATLLSGRVEGDAAAAGRTHAAVAAEIRQTGNPLEPPAVVVSGGELTVSVGDADGVGGPNQTCALAAAPSLPGDAAFACVDTDGVDGPTDYAGAVVDANTANDPAAVRRALAARDATGYLDGRNALVETGPTGTNVNDLRVLVVED